MRRGNLVRNQIKQVSKYLRNVQLLTVSPFSFIRYKFARLLRLDHERLLRTYLTLHREHNVSYENQSLQHNLR
jgi:Leucine-rich repeat (LRR) protein